MLSAGVGFVPWAPAHGWTTGEGQCRPGGRAGGLLVWEVVIHVAEARGVKGGVQNSTGPLEVQAWVCHCLWSTVGGDSGAVTCRKRGS